VTAFDDSVRNTRPEDYLLLVHGHVHLFRHDWARDRLLADLSGLGYDVVEADLSGCHDAASIRASIAAVPGWPAGPGPGSWPAFTNGLEDLLRPDRPLLVLVLLGIDRLYQLNPTSTETMLDLVASAGRWHLLFGRRLLCLLQTDNLDATLELPQIGATYIEWNRHEWHIDHREGVHRPPWIAPD
jgi:hypothetical protein